MLLRENCRWHEHRHLLSIHHRFERRANANLRLSEADVAADQTVHRLCPFHVALGLANGFELMPMCPGQ